MQSWLIAPIVLAGCGSLLGFEEPVVVEPAPPALKGPPADLADARFCVGNLTSFCFPSEPAGVFMLSGEVNLDAIPSPCLPDVTPSDICVIAAETLIVSDYYHPWGMRPLALVATAAIVIDEKIDLAGGDTIFMPPGATIAATDGHCTFGAAPTGGGGGAGGSFGNAGANGGSATNSNPGIADAADAGLAFELRAGCPGQPGHNGSSAAGGLGGGALYVYAGTSIELTEPVVFETNGGTIEVSGSAGRGGSAGVTGGGGGGSGGMVVLDAPSIVNNGTIRAVGGGGGEGGGGSNPGQNGSDVNGGGTSSQNGGDGGDGAFTDHVATVGAPSSGSSGGGGGGGGGAGRIVWISEPTGTGAMTTP